MSSGALRKREREDGALILAARGGAKKDRRSKGFLRSVDIDGGSL